MEVIVRERKNGLVPASKATRKVNVSMDEEMYIVIKQLSILTSITMTDLIGNALNKEFRAYKEAISAVNNIIQQTKDSLQN